MESKLKPRDLFTLLLALLLGGGVAAFPLRDETGASSEPPSSTASAAALPASSSPSASSHPSRQSPEAVACASAWESLKDGRLKREDREQVQLKLLAEWPVHDLSSALTAYFLELDLSPLQEAIVFNRHMLPAMDANPDLVEELLNSGRLGLKTGLLRKAWIPHLGDTDPGVMFDRLAEFPASERQHALDYVIAGLSSVQEDPADWQAGMKRISALLAGPHGKQDALSIASSLGENHSYEDLNAAYLATADPVLQHLFVVAAEQALNGDDPFAEPVDIPLEMQKLPEPLRSVVGKRLEEPTAGELPAPAE